MQFGHLIRNFQLFSINPGASVAQRQRNELPRDGPGFDSRSRHCIYRASRPSQGTVNGVPSLNDLAVDGTLNTNKQIHKSCTYITFKSAVKGQVSLF